MWAENNHPSRVGQASNVWRVETPANAKQSQNTAGTEEADDSGIICPVSRCRKSARRIPLRHPQPKAPPIRSCSLRQPPPALDSVRGAAYARDFHSHLGLGCLTAVHPRSDCYRTRDAEPPLCRHTTQAARRASCSDTAGQMRRWIGIEREEVKARGEEW